MYDMYGTSLLNHRILTVPVNTIAPFQGAVGCYSQGFTLCLTNCTLSGRGWLLLGHSGHRAPPCVGVLLTFGTLLVVTGRWLHASPSVNIRERSGHLGNYC